MTKRNAMCMNTMLCTMQKGFFCVVACCALRM